MATTREEPNHKAHVQLCGHKCLVPHPLFLPRSSQATADVQPHIAQSDREPPDKDASLAKGTPLDLKGCRQKLSDSRLTLRPYLNRHVSKGVTMSANSMRIRQVPNMLLKSFSCTARSIARREDSSCVVLAGFASTPRCENSAFFHTTRAPGASSHCLPRPRPRSRSKKTSAGIKARNIELLAYSFSL
jgi:hypothetical protein